MNSDRPYEYHEDTLGVQARFIFSGRNAHEKSLELIGDRGLRSRIESDKITKLRSKGPGQPLLLRWDTLPQAWQELLVKTFGDPPQRVKTSLFQQHYRRDYAAFDFYTGFRFPDNSRIADDAKIEEYTTNASVLNTVIEVFEKRRSFIKLLKGRTGSAWEAVCAEAVKFKDVEYHTLPECPRVLRRTMNGYKIKGYQALISGRHGNNNRRIVTPDVEIFINNLFAEFRHKPNKYEVAKQYEGFLSGYVEVINNATGEIYSPKEFPRLSTSTITGYLSKWHNAIATEHIRGGDRQKLLSKFIPYASLEQPECAGSIISIDDRQPPFEYAKNSRVWFYNGIDLGSEAFVCWVYGKTKEGIILDFYRQLVRNYAQWGLNLPAELEAELSLNASFKDTFLKEGNMFQYVRIEPNKARGKRIEQYYRPLRYKHEKGHEGWLPRPFALDESNQAGPAIIPQIPYEQIIERCLWDIQNWNNTEHSKIEGKTRWEVFLQTQNPNVRPTNYRGIIPYLGYTTKTSCHAGIIRLQKKEYLLGNDGLIAVGSPLIDLMTAVEGRDITIHWLDDNFGNILKAYVYQGDRFVCEAVLKPTYQRARIERTAKDDHNLHLMSSYTETITAYTRRRKGDFDKVTVIDNTPRTLNNSFQIEGLGSYQPRESEPEEINLNGAQIGFNSGLIGSQTPSKTSLKNRF